MSNANELGQFIPLHYHYNMLQDTVRMGAFKEAIDRFVHPGMKVLELGSGTGVLSWFAAQRAARVWSVERNPALVQLSRDIIARNTNAMKIQVIEDDASTFVPPEPVDVVICEMLHVGLLREKQTAVIGSFKHRYNDRYPDKPWPRFLPEACIQAIQPVQHDFTYNGYHAPVCVFQPAQLGLERTVELANPVAYQIFQYNQDDLPQSVGWDGEITINQPGRLTGFRIITKNVLAIIPEENRTLDWFSQYLVLPFESPKFSRDLKPGNVLHVSLGYTHGAEITDLQNNIKVRLVK